MEPPLTFGFRDILWACARALKAKKIAAMTAALLTGHLVFQAFSYIAFAIDGKEVGLIWRVYGLLVYVDPHLEGVIAQGTYYVGMFAGILCVMVGFCAVSIADIESLRGNPFVSMTQSLRFAMKRLPQMFLTLLSIALFLLFVTILFAIFGGISRLPWIGDWIYAIFFVLPNFVIAILTVFIFVVLQVAVLVLPSVLAAQRTRETFTALVETFSTILRRPVHWLSYTLIGLVTAKLASFVYGYFAYRAVEFISWSTSILGGRRMDDLIRSGLGHLPVNSDIARESMNIFPGIDFGFSVVQWARPGDDAAVSYVMAAMLFVVFATVVGYALAVVASSQARAYVVIRYQKDSYRVDKEDPLLFTPAHVNPRVGE